MEELTKLIDDLSYADNFNLPLPKEKLSRFKVLLPMYKGSLTPKYQELSKRLERLCQSI